MAKHKRRKTDSGGKGTCSSEIGPVTPAVEGLVHPKPNSLSIDTIFSKAKTKAKTKAPVRLEKLGSFAPRQKPPKETPAGSKDDLFGTSAQRKRRRDPEGLAIYSAEELRVGEGGGTAKCPFDCDCCF